MHTSRLAGIALIRLDRAVNKGPGQTARVFGRKRPLRSQLLPRNFANCRRLAAH